MSRTWLLVPILLLGCFLTDCTGAKLGDGGAAGGGGATASGTSASGSVGGATTASTAQSASTAATVTASASASASSSSTGGGPAITCGAAQLDGAAGSGIAVPAATGYDPAGSVTVEAWIYPTDVPGLTYIAGHGGDDQSGTSSYGLWLKPSYNQIVFCVRSNSPTSDCVATTSGWNANRWTHVAGVFDAATKTATLFVSGSKGDSFTGSYQVLAKQKSVPLTVGNTDPNSSKAYPFTGFIDEVRVSKVARYAAAFNPAARFTADADTVALFHFDEAPGKTAVTDSAIPPNDGALSGTAAFVARCAPEVCGAVSFDPNKSGVVTTDPGDFNPGGSFTLEAWVRADAKTGSTVTIARYGSQAPNLSFYLGGTAEFYGTAFFGRFGVSCDGTSMSIIGGEYGYKSNTNPEVPHVWSHFAGVFDGPSQTMSFFTDGKLEATAMIGCKAPHLLSNTPLQISDAAAPWPGSVGELRLSSVARYSADFVPEPSFKDDKDTLALYHFDESSGTMVSDSSSNKGKASLTGPGAQLAPGCN